MRREQLFNTKGFTLVEALVGIGLLAILVGTNLSMISTFFSLRDQQSKKHNFYESMNRLASTLSDKAVCNALMDTLTPKPYLISKLKDDLEVSEIRLSPTTNPIVKKNGYIFDDTTLIEKITLKLAQEPSTNPNQPNSYIWLKLDYYYGPPGSPVKDGSFRGTKSILYEVGLNPASPDGSTIPGSFTQGSCMDYITKRDKQTSAVMCMILISNYNDGKCNMIDHPDIRETACHMTGYKYGGRYCDSEKL